MSSFDKLILQTLKIQCETFKYDFFIVLQKRNTKQKSWYGIGSLNKLFGSLISEVALPIEDDVSDSTKLEENPHNCKQDPTCKFLLESFESDGDSLSLEQNEHIDEDCPRSPNSYSDSPTNANSKKKYDKLVMLPDEDEVEVSLEQIVKTDYPILNEEEPIIWSINNLDYKIGALFLQRTFEANLRHDIRNQRMKVNGVLHNDFLIKVLKLKNPYCSFSVLERCYLDLNSNYVSSFTCQHENCNIQAQILISSSRDVTIYFSDVNLLRKNTFEWPNLILVKPHGGDLFSSAFTIERKHKFEKLFDLEIMNEMFKSVKPFVKKKIVDEKFYIKTLSEVLGKLNPFCSFSPFTKCILKTKGKSFSVNFICTEKICAVKVKVLIKKSGTAFVEFSKKSTPKNLQISIVKPESQICNPIKLSHGVVKDLPKEKANLFLPKVLNHSDCLTEAELKSMFTMKGKKHGEILVADTGYGVYIKNYGDA